MLVEALTGTVEFCISNDEWELKNEKDNTSAPELNWHPIVPSTGNHIQPNGNTVSRFISVGPRVIVSYPRRRSRGGL
jgi:hypothetical protein